MIHVGSSSAKFLSLAVITSSVIASMSYSHSAQAGEVTAKQEEVTAKQNQPTAIAEAKIPTVSEYKTDTVTRSRCRFRITPFGAE